MKEKTFMLTKELIEEYKKIFILCIETEGQRTGDSNLQNIESKLDRIDLCQLISPRKIEDLGLGDLISIYLSSLFIPSDFASYLMEDLSKLPGFIKETSYKALDLYRRALKGVSEQFCKKNNLTLKINFVNEEF